MIQLATWITKNVIDRQKNVTHIHTHTEYKPKTENTLPANSWLAAHFAGRGHGLILTKSIDIFFNVENII